MESLNVETGEILELGSGEYGDYWHCGVIRALEDFSLAQAMDRYIAVEFPGEPLPQQRTVREEAFIEWMCDQRLVEVIRTRTVHIQSLTDNLLASPLPEDYTGAGDPQPLAYESFDPDAEGGLLL